MASLSGGGEDREMEEGGIKAHLLNPGAGTKKTVANQNKIASGSNSFTLQPDQFHLHPSYILRFLVTFSFIKGCSKRLNNY